MSAECIAVSGEMLAFVGGRCATDAAWPQDAIALGFTLGTHPVLVCRGEAEGLDADIVLIVARAACGRIFGESDLGDASWHLPHELRQIVVAIAGCAIEGAARPIYRGGKAIELLCETMRLMRSDALVPLHSPKVASLADARRLIAARRLIDECWHEKLTIDGIARACGLNRVKLTRGFRAMFNATVAEAISERRLAAASQLLCTTDLPISSIGYDSGYLNNASFARAFARRFGVSPSDYRAARLAA